MVLKIIKVIFIFLFIIVLSNSCYYDNDQDLFKYVNNAACDTSKVTYSATIAPLISANCSACHSSADYFTNSGYVLDNYSDLKFYINKVWGDINGFAGYNLMPRNGNKLPPCDISKIQAWMIAGTPNN